MTKFQITNTFRNRIGILTWLHNNLGYCKNVIMHDFYENAYIGNNWRVMLSDDQKLLDIELLNEEIKINLLLAVDIE